MVHVEEDEDEDRDATESSKQMVTMHQVFKEVEPITPKFRRVWLAKLKHDLATLLKED